MSGLDDLRFRLLGPVGAFAGTEPVELPSHRPRVLLAALLLRVNQTVPIDELVDVLWDGYETASTLIALGETQEKSGDLTEARASWQQAASILDTLNHPDATAIHARLAT